MRYMIMMTRWLSFALAAVILPTVSGQVSAQVASAWNEHPNSKVRLIAGEGRVLGIEVQLAPGWKTYWRMPGDAGVPPGFDWTGSDNVASFEVLYPAPATMKDAAGVAVGYQGTVIFPVTVKPVQDGKPLRVNLEFAFGVCKDICIPVESKLSLMLDGAKPWPASVPLKAHLARVPLVAADVATAAPLIRSVGQDVVQGKTVLKVATAAALDVYLEAPDNLFVPLAQKGPAGEFTFDLSMSPDFKELIGKPLRLTAVTATGGVETTVVLK